MDKILHLLQQKKELSQELLQTFVEMESNSYDKAGVDLLGQKVIDVFSRFNLETKQFLQSDWGNHLRFQFGKGDKQILLISHLDTVYPKGTIDSMLFKVNDGKAFGPGVVDMKASYVMVYHLFELLQQESSLNASIVWLLTSDEEVGSPTGRFIVEQEAKRSDVVFVLEPATDDGALKTARKGGGNFKIEVNGISAHAGLNPEEGANAIEELARQIIDITQFTDIKKGTTVNPGKIIGGTMFNVVPDYASCEVDVRVALLEEAERINCAFRSLTPTNERTSIAVNGSIYRPPLVKTEQTSALVDMAKAIAKEISVELTDTAVGGGSDGNYAALTGVPVLDGLGPYGGGAHSPNEFLLIHTIAERTTILYELIKRYLSLNTVR